MDYCIAFFQRQQKENAFRIYVTDALYAIAANTVKMFGGSSMQMRYADLINGKPQDTEQETKDAAEVVNHIKDRLNKLKG